MNYRLLISIEVVEFIERLPSRNRKALRNVIDGIGRDPMGRSDAEDYDDIGRRLEIAIAGSWCEWEPGGLFGDNADPSRFERCKLI